MFWAKASTLSSPLAKGCGENTDALTHRVAEGDNDVVALRGVEHYGAPRCHALQVGGGYRTTCQASSTQCGRWLQNDMSSCSTDSCTPDETRLHCASQVKA